MQVGQRLELKQSQQLVMTPRLQQAIRLLQMSNLDAADYIAAEVERNPFLRVEDGGGEAPPEAAAPRDGVDRQIARSDPGGGEEPFDTGRENLYESAEARPPRHAASGSASSGSGIDASLYLEERLAAPDTLRDHLLRQLAVVSCSPQARLLASLLVDDLDEAGYLRVCPYAVAEQAGGDAALAEEALAALQSCEPTGVGARDLAECLRLQLAERNRLDPAMDALLERLDDLAELRLDELRRACGVGDEDLTEMIAEIRALSPRPAAGFGGSVAQTLVPDVFVRRKPSGGWSVEVNSDALPQVLLDTTYAAELNAAGETETRSFVAECRQNADWLIRALDQRAQTILKVASEIVRRQGAFFTEGVAGIRPMTLRMVADEINMHESTVSRVTANKHLSCERGVFAMKFFFTQGVAATNGEDSVSAEAVRVQIKTMIDKENSDKPLSDEKIVNLLKQTGVKIARRTVAKYRESMNIPSSAQRRKRNLAALTR